MRETLGRAEENSREPADWNYFIRACFRICEAAAVPLKATRRLMEIESRFSGLRLGCSAAAPFGASGPPLFGRRLRV